MASPSGTREAAESRCARAARVPGVARVSTRWIQPEPFTRGEQPIRVERGAVHRVVKEQAVLRDPGSQHGRSWPASRVGDSYKRRASRRCLFWRGNPWGVAGSGRDKLEGANARSAASRYLLARIADREIAKVFFFEQRGC